MALRRMLGAPTAWCVGMGVAIGSGIFRTPGEIAYQLQSPTLILLAWLIGGAIVLAQGMVTAEVATRFPQAGGEYVFLREGYGRFPAFFFGWAYTVFVIGAGSAVIAVALGDFACDYFQLHPRYAGLIGSCAVAAVIGINIAGLRSGANVQNGLTILKIVCLLGLVFVGMLAGDRNHPGIAPPIDMRSPSVSAFLTAMMPVLWSYDGTTDCVKLAEEIRDVRRALPLAVLGSTVALTVLYIAVNFALLRVVPASEMSGLASVPGEAMGRLFGDAGRSLMLLVGIIVCLGSLSSTIPATVRVTFALARDGLTFRRLAVMSAGQSPVQALLAIGTITILFTLTKSFSQVLGIYFLAATILFGLSYASLLVFRYRETVFPRHAFRCPCGPFLAVLVIAVQSSIAVQVAIDQPMQAVYTAALLGTLAALYWVWRPSRFSG